MERSNLVLMLLIFLGLISRLDASTEPATRQVISDLRDSIVQKLGWKPEDVIISKINSPDAKIGHTTMYEFDLEIGNALIPLKLSEEVTKWQLLEDVFPPTDTEAVDGNSLVKKNVDFNPVLSPFQLSGPLELWIQDADHMRLSVPHDVEAGILKKVMLADGAVVTVKGARELDMRQPIQITLPLRSNNTEDSNLASVLIAVAAKLRHASSHAGKPLSLRIVGPSSLVASSVNEAEAASTKLKVKRLAPGAVELVTRHQESEHSAVILEPVLSSLDQSWMWPLPSLNATKLKGFESLLEAILGAAAERKIGSMRMSKARATAATFIKIEFELEKKLSAGDIPSDWPEWRTRPSVSRLQFQMTAKLEGDKVIPVNVQQLDPVIDSESASFTTLLGNVTASKIPVVYVPSSPVTL